MVLARPSALATAMAVALLVPLASTASAEGSARANPPQQDALTSVSCPRPTFCMAVGYRAYGARGALAETWNGRRWRVLATPSLTGRGGRSLLQAVSCVSTTRCVAIGSKSRTSSSPSSPVVEQWNGTRWRLLDLRFPAQTFLGRLSCLRRACMIVGSHTVGTLGRYVPLAGQLRGTRLRLVKAVLPRGVFGGFLSGVSCTSVSFCVAVGGYILKVGGTVNLAETWNGTAWRVTRTWHPGSLDTVLTSVSCASPALCMAGGAPVAGLRGSFPLMLLWKGGSWHAMGITGRQLPGPPDVPAGVSCPATASCVASEYGLNSDRSAALTWRGGRTLAIHRVLHPATGDLYAISCPRPDRCIAVGALAPRSAGTRNGTFAELWNGRAWRLLPM